MSEKLIHCTHCNSQIPTCYETQVDGNSFKFCINCGFSTNSLMKMDSEYFKNALNTMPQLYIDALYVDEFENIWSPTTVNMVDKGMVFLAGTSLENCEWCAMKATPLSDEEAEKLNKNGTSYKFKMDKDTLKNFGKDGFMDGMIYIGAIETPEQK